MRMVFPLRAKKQTSMAVSDPCIGFLDYDLIMVTKGPNALPDMQVLILTVGTVKLDMSKYCSN